MFRPFLLGFLLLLALPAGAQETVEPLTLSVSPRYPKPFQTVTVTPGSTLLDLARSTVTVSANGTVVAKGSGAEPVNVRMGGPGTATTISLSVVSEGKTYTLQTVIRPADVSLVIEPVGTMHPFYRGGSAVSSEGRLRIVAIPDIRTSAGSRIPADSLVYTWRIGDQVLEAQSGIGKSFLSATAPVEYRDTVVDLTVASADSAYVASASTVVSASSPTMRVYRNDPLLGPLFDTALGGTLVMDAEELTFRAVPYFFASPPTITWSVNGAPSGGERDITLRSTGSGSGAATLSVSAKLPALFQSADMRTKITFGEGGGLGIFGL